MLNGNDNVKMQIENEKIREISTALKEEAQLKGSSIIPSIKENGVVVLTGGINREEQRAIASKTVGAIPGIFHVENNLSVSAGTISTNYSSTDSLELANETPGTGKPNSEKFNNQSVG